MRGYRHRPLDIKSDEIRLLQIELATGDDDPITVRIKHVRLSDGLKFNALSYAWGGDSPCYNIVIHDDDEAYYYAIRENLCDFFNTTRFSISSWRSEWIWIDQICIDQGNPKERCHQVNSMAQLYSTAHSTIIWPGLPPKTFRAVDEIDPFASSIRGPSPLENIDTYSEVRRGSVRRRLNAKTMSGAVLHGLTTSSYWSRLWVIQEIVLAEHVRMLVADTIYDLRDFHKVLRILKRDSDQLPVTARHPEILAAVPALYTRIDKLLRMRHRRQDYASNTWADVLILCEGTQHSVLLDRFYGVLGMLAKDLQVQPDYEVVPLTLLKTLFEKQIAHSSGRPLNMLANLHAIVKVWAAAWAVWLEKPVPNTRLMGIPPPPDPGHEPRGYPRLRILTMMHNVGLYLDALGIPVPAELKEFKKNLRCEDWVAPSWDPSLPYL
ncbi:HET-domain-containing protein [Didymella exigua CBS 183.55]|uniref:HET-domain-containing protein n=1 Tax=Didymella exigua CBS 183.55 TaxID=1150837 RepID=A0A6A5RTD2_9PLEO|nr:HET-domain-containing protein [Didymella exigua CBS 183.55]KAF1931102.1 HET-domain-containing protein [Didymella exigua CBS 183.55]